MIWPLAVKRHKVRDRAAVGAEKSIRFTSNILPRWARPALLHKSREGFILRIQGGSWGA